jgi:TadE-like protein
MPTTTRRPTAARRLLRRLSRGSAGVVTAETAMALPAVVLVLMLLLWGIAAATDQMRCVDAARAAARGLARGESAAASRAAALEAAPQGATVAVSGGAARVHVAVAATVRLPGPLLGRLPGLRVSGEAVAAREPR